MSDKRVPPGDAGCVLGFIEKNASGYEVLHLGRGFAWYRFSSWDEATTHFISTASGDLGGGSATSVAEEHELSWMHAKTA